MKNLPRTHVSKRILLGGWLAAFAFLASATQAQQPAARLTAEIKDKERRTILGTHPLKARPEFEAGRMDPAAKLQGVTIVFARTATQEADLQALITAQQDPGSPSYHKWLTPEEFGAQFGVADADLAKVQSWLEQHGFSVDGIARSKNSMSFSGTVAQIEATFGIEMHNYKIAGETHYAPSQDLRIPAVLATLVQTVTNLSTFRPKPHLRPSDPRMTVDPNFTSSQTQSHFMGPGDVATIYDVTPAYKAGYNGAGQTIAVVGQSDIVMADIENFQKAAGFAIKDPVRVLVPSSGTATVSSGDEAESDLDLEYTSTIASGATIDFVYTGNNPSFNVFNAISYAITNNLAPIISVSYGICESALGGLTGYNGANSIFPQAATQGQSILVAAGDNGSTDCYGETGLTTAQQQALAVDFPASSQYVTAMGGTEFPAADTASTNTTYWQPASGTDVISSALSYIPETAWNDDAFGSLASGGGGASAFNPKPSWQTGVPGISGTMRLVPDISLASSPNYTGYLFCSSDTAFTGVTGSCSNGFRDTSNKNLTLAGGTSFAAPIFAGMLAIVNQNLKSTGQGVINSTLYTLAASSTTYGKAFHDITSGGNQCLVPGTTVCSTTGASEYPATTGYDEATGLGSIDFFNLLTAWPGSTTSLVASKTTVAAATSTPAPGASDTITITVASGSSSTTTTPTGTLTIAVDGTTQTSSLALVNGSATFSFSSTVIGSHTILATYSGDTTYAVSTGSVTVTVVSATLVASKTTEVAATTTPASGATDAITITVASGSVSSTTTPTGTVAVSVDGTPASTLTLTNGSATYNFSSTVAGSHMIAATYSGDTTYAASSTSIPVTVAAPVQVASQTIVAAATTTPTFGASDTITITVASGATSSTATPTGKVTVSVDGVTQAPTLTLTNGSVTYSFSSTSVGTHTISATYGGDTTYLSSSGSVGVTVPPVASNTAVAAATSTPAAGAADAITIAVASGLAASTAVPTGTVTVSVDGTAQTPALTLTNGSATYNFSSTTAGAHTISAAYAGNTTYAGSNGSVSVTVSAAPKSFTLAATNVTVAAGTSGTSTVTVTPQNSYTGAVTWTVTSSPVFTNGCFSLPNTVVSGTTAVNATLTVATASTACPLPASVGPGGNKHSVLGPGALHSENRPQPPANFPTYQTTWAMAGLLLIAACARRSRELGLFAAACLLVAMGAGLSGCAGSSTPTGGGSANVAKGNYIITIVGTDTTTASETATTTVTVTVN